ncbi:hypothetical protein CRENBAI_018654 [Crenichthys baileyi]|uniref:Uncharacterized protein n=1 Tax=Crenichthys baileyi TaxID=28760 RepID=A0AAV9S189_9TELE
MVPGWQFHIRGQVPLVTVPLFLSFVWQQSERLPPAAGNASVERFPAFQPARRRFPCLLLEQLQRCFPHLCLPQLCLQACLRLSPPPLLSSPHITGATPDELEDLVRIAEGESQGDGGELWDSCKTVFLLPTSDLQSGAAAQPMSCLLHHASRVALLHSLSKVSRAVKGALTASAHRRCCRKHASLGPVIGGLGDASAPAPTTEGLGCASPPVPVIGGLSVPPAPASAVGRLDAPASAPASVGQLDASGKIEDVQTPTLDSKALQGIKERLVIVLVAEPSDEGFEDEALPDPVHFKKKLALVLVFEPSEEGFKEKLLPDPVPERFEDELPPDPVPVQFKEKPILVVVSEPSD